jgi:shikimate dehydrogenase
MKIASVIGWPIAHSRSPIIHTHWLKTYGIQGDYTKQAVTPEELPSFIDSLRQGERIGINVTLPHKERAVACVDEPDDRVMRIGALNTIWRDGAKLCATSTDGPGFLANLQHQMPDFDHTIGPILILGAGGSTRSLVDEFLRQGAKAIGIYNRTASRAEVIAQDFGRSVHALDAQDLPSAMRRCALIVNTTAAGMNGSEPLSLPWNELNPSAVVADIVYTPLVTAFLQQAQFRGHRTVTGLGMLLHQAVFGFEKWFGRKPAVTQELYDLVANDISPGLVS